MSDLHIPFVPENLAVRGSTAAKMKVVEGDVYNICNRIKEIDKRLRVVLHEGHERPWVIMEDCDDGVVRMVQRYEVLEAHILEDLQRMRAIPFEERMRKLEQMDKANDRLDDIDPHGESMERLAFEFKRALVDSNIEPAANLKSLRPSGRRRS